ncbi:CPBP family intramembrane glutamic endopeptidase [Nakamurella endophytica]|uniref:CAAX prenyl protease 2/Lysostaphin resistance protein A-like domain-containing protein n=1 Tax=Nakamurella endophytica TaxID=1748367 RepID=A0A917WIT2_9ACTN|nr:CPBP family intramembrane glutamic endopeptidase [Nakamurella endophytica]GGM09107.1 hypothetical protein GCM10011594_31280 [Nakamurella endophytica]
MSLRSVPDGRTAVPPAGWLPVVTVAVLATTTADVVADDHLPRWWWLATLAVCIAGYLGTVAGLRRLRRRPGPSGSTPPTVPIPVVPTGPTARPARGPARLRRPAVLLASALAALGASFAWSVASAPFLHQRPVSIPGVPTVGGAVGRAALLALNTSVLEECSVALVVLTAAMVTDRFRPRHWDPRSVAVVAVTAGTAVRVLLHVPLWGVGAVARVGLAVVLAWLFWRTRRIWPLVLAHVLWDTVVLQSAMSPALEVKALCGLAVLGWGVAGTVVTIVALVRSRRLVQAETLAARRRPADGRWPGSWPPAGAPGSWPPAGAPGPWPGIGAPGPWPPGPWPPADVPGHRPPERVDGNRSQPF